MDAFFFKFSFSFFLLLFLLFSDNTPAQGSCYTITCKNKNVDVGDALPISFCLHCFGNTGADRESESAFSFKEWSQLEPHLPSEKLKKTPDPWHRKQGMMIPHTCLKFFPPRPGLGRLLIRAFAHYLHH